MINYDDSSLTTELQHHLKWICLMSFEHFRSFQKKILSSIKVIISKPPKSVLFHEKKVAKVMKVSLQWIWTAHFAGCRRFTSINLFFLSDSLNWSPCHSRHGTEQSPWCVSWGCWLSPLQPLHWGEPQSWCFDPSLMQHTQGALSGHQSVPSGTLVWVTSWIIPTCPIARVYWLSMQTSPRAAMAGTGLLVRH